MTQGKLIVIEGLDGSGKATQTKLLHDALSAQHDIMQITFPRYESPSSEPIKMYLNGTFGAKPGDVNAYAASTFYAVDRFASYKTLWGEFYRTGGIVVSDRYTTSNAVHQCSKLPAQEWDAYLQWLFDFEYQKIAIPAPDVVIYLDVEAEVTQTLMAQRYHGDETRKDIHEKDVEYLKQSRAAAHYCAKTLGWKHVHCSQNGQMRTIESIHADILAAVREALSL